MWKEPDFIKKREKFHPTSKMTVLLWLTYAMWLYHMTISPPYLSHNPEAPHVAQFHSKVQRFLVFVFLSVFPTPDGFWIVVFGVAVWPNGFFARNGLKGQIKFGNGKRALCARSKENICCTNGMAWQRFMLCPFSLFDPLTFSAMSWLIIDNIQISEQSSCCVLKVVR